MHSSDGGTVHIIGAGLAGLAAAVRLAGSGRAVAVHEATTQAGGRCRSYHDQGTGMLIDNGVHLLLSGNRAVLSFVDAIGSRAGLHGPPEAEFPFIDLANGEQWTLRFGDGRFPWWLFDKERRVPQTAVVDYLPLVRLAWTSSDRPIGQVMNCTGPIYNRLLEPLLLAAL
ncbi:MAG TPA: FAD-dependent oxidoreductase, partial [Pseudolabrys sp.]|nr:FAD-dependent oxidoreductase [Pseudolabrys sp.]